MGETAEPGAATGGVHGGVGGGARDPSVVDAPPGGVWETLDALVGQWGIPRPVAVVEVGGVVEEGRDWVLWGESVYTWGGICVCVYVYVMCM